MKLVKKHPIMFSIGCLDFLIVIVLVALLFLKNSKNSVLDISVAPIDAVVAIDGRNYENGAYNINSGEHRVEISKEGYQTKKYTITTEQGFSTKLRDYLVSDEGSFVDYLSDVENILILEDINQDDNTAITDFLDSYIKQLDLVETLPTGYFNKDGEKIRAFTIQEKNDEECNKLACLEIIDVSGENNEKFAKKYLENRGFILDFYEISYGKLLE